IAELQVHLRDHHSIRLSRHMPKADNSTSYMYGLACENCNNQVDSFDSFYRAHSKGKCVKHISSESTITLHKDATTRTKPLATPDIAPTTFISFEDNFRRSSQDLGPTTQSNLSTTSFAWEPFSQFQLHQQLHNKPQDHSRLNDIPNPYSPPLVNPIPQVKANPVPNTAAATTSGGQVNPHILSRPLSFEDIQRQILNDVCMQDISDNIRQGTSGDLATTTIDFPVDTSDSISVSTSSPSSASFDRFLNTIMTESLDNVELTHPTIPRARPINTNTSMDRLGENQVLNFGKFDGSFSSMLTNTVNRSSDALVGGYVAHMNSMWCQNQSSISKPSSRTSSSNSLDESSYTDVESPPGDLTFALHVHSDLEKGASDR
ncbi:hypothetical protein HDU76_010146, partial [Blyttiomyces sp. JEL0837]